MQMCFYSNSIFALLQQPDLQLPIAVPIDAPILSELGFLV